MNRLGVLFTAIAFVLTFVAIIVPTAPATAAAEEASGEDSGGGKAIFLAQKCNLCHGVSSVGIEAKTKSEKVKGPDLTGVGTRHSRDRIDAYMKRTEKIDGKEHKREFKGSDEELQAIVDWLLEQKAEG